MTYFLILSASANPSTSWGVDIGDSAVYWIDTIDVKPTNDSEPINVALFMGDTNRTNLVLITSQDVASLNYTLGLTNGTNVLQNQQVKIEETDIEGNTFLIPTGDLPIVLPLSAGDQGTYLQYLASSADLANFIIAGLIKDQNITNVESAEIQGIYRSDLFNVSGSASFNDLANFSTLLLPSLNMTDQISLGENQTITDVDVDILASYNSTDGMLMELNVDTAVHSVIVESENSTRSETLTVNATIIRQSYTPIQEFLSTVDTSQISSIVENPVLLIGVVPAFLLLSRRKT